MTVAVVAAMSSELAPLTRRLRLRREDRSGLAVRVGDVDGRPIIGTVVGVGPRAARRSVERLLDVVTPELVVMVGVCGGIDPTLTIGDLVAPEAVLEEDTGRTVVPRPLPGIASMGRLVTCSKLVLDDTAHDRWRAAGVVAVDMETAAVGMVCGERDVPWSVVRAVSDRPADGLVDASILDLLKEDGSPNLPAVLRRVVRHPSSVATLARLGRDSSRAARASVDAAVTALRAPR